MKLTDSEDFIFITNEERMAADAELRKRKKEVEKISKLSIQTILATMPQTVKNLQKAYENLSVVEAKVEDEIIKKRK